ncbi:iron ABC transporter permease [bacterium]|nr:iron ABC transporter permease [bacterium]
MKSEPNNANGSRILLPYLVSLALLLVTLASFFIGRYHLGLESIVQILMKLFGFPTTELVSSTEYAIFVHIRLPRILMVFFTGGALAMAGGVYQGIFKNPLVSPDILGVTTGASFGAALGILLPSGSEITIRLAAFIFGIVAVAAAYLISRLGKTSPLLMLVLSGIIVSSFFGAGLSILKYLSDPYQQLPSIVFWIMGGFQRTSWDQVNWSLPMILCGVAVMFALRFKLNPLSLGDLEARSLGMRVELIRLVFIAMATLVVAASVSVCGAVGWIGLVIPHLSRLLIGPHHGRMIPFSFVLGALFLLLMDNCARTLTPSEIPIGIITAFLGAPMFAYFLVTAKRTGWNL